MGETFGRQPLLPMPIWSRPQTGANVGVYFIAAGSANRKLSLDRGFRRDDVARSLPPAQRSALARLGQEYLRQIAPRPAPASIRAAMIDTPPNASHSLPTPKLAPKKKNPAAT